MGQIIHLVGMMGCGKSTVGRALAERLGALFVDLDREIEDRSGASVEELFARGETHFRAVERATGLALADELEAREGVAVLALGGGAFADPELRERLARSGISVFLDIDGPTLLARLGPEARRERPLFARAPSLFDPGAERRFLELYAAREAVYAGATHRVDASPPPEAVARRILEAIRNDD